MEELLRKFESKKPEIVFEWQDSETEAEGWVVINSLKGGAAGGGTRMRKGLDKHEVTSLAKTMEIKFTCSGPDIGGAKSGINFDPNDPRKAGVVERWYKAVVPILKAYYGTGGDLNLDEVKEVIPVTSELGLEHPQEGVLVGHFQPSVADKRKKIEQLREGVSKFVSKSKYTPSLTYNLVVADLITGWGVSESVRLYYDIFGGDLKGKKVIVQGWGNVAAMAAFYMAQEGAKIVGIIDREGGLIEPDGLSFDKVKELCINKKGNQLNAENLLSFDEVNEQIWDVAADVFIPAAASRLVTQDQLQRMHKAGLSVISSGANVPFADQEIFYGKIARFADENFVVIPDFIANCGMARTFAYLMGDDVDLSDDAIFEDVTTTIAKALQDIKDKFGNSDEMMKKAFELALQKVSVD